MCLAMPGRVVSIRDAAGLRMGRVEFGGVAKEVCLACVPELVVGDWALVHAGLAIARLDTAAARATMAALAALAMPTPDRPDRGAGDEAALP